MTSDPSAFLRDMLGQWERMANSFGSDTLKSEEFTRSLHGANTASMAMQAVIAQAMDKALAATNLPSRNDIADLSARVGRVEASLARIEAMLAAPVARHPVPSAPEPVPAGPKRTRKPPAA